VKTNSDKLSDQKIALVCSSPGLRNFLRTRLQILGCKKVTEVSALAGAEDVLAKQDPDIIFLSWTMKTEGDGIAFLVKLRKIRQFLDTAIVIVSGQVTQDHLVQSIFSDADEFLALPFTGKGLEMIFQKALTKRKHPSPFLQTMRDGMASLIDRKFADAKQHFLHALTQKPQSAAPRFYLGFIELIFGNFDRAMEQFRSAVATHPNHLKSQLGKAFLHKKFNQSEDYYQTLKKVIEIFPAHVSAVNDLLPMAIERNDMDVAYQTLKHILQVHAEFPTLASAIEIYGLSILTRCTQNKNKTALKELLPDLRSFRVAREKFTAGLVSLLRKVGMSQEADREAAHAHLEFGNSYDLGYGEALSYFHAGQYDRAVERLHSLLEQFGDREPALELLLRSYERMRNFSKAKHIRNQLINMRRKSAPDPKKASGDE
jgi:tetratricopeptide (TPR) repeat protein